ncbi:MAG: hypothetical protein C6W57_13260 [Caldibacillus debilis]|nr:MAG: hypothetical protein C6W57_13260 [Caldibacillus debilis]REJ23274.1 MAG: hypothetical protein C6W56_15735 [Caldibacillus debilis]
MKPSRKRAGEAKKGTSGKGADRLFSETEKGALSASLRKGGRPAPGCAEWDRSRKRKGMVWGICAGRRRKKDAGPIGKDRRRLRAKGFKRGRHRFEWESRE